MKINPSTKFKIMTDFKRGAIVEIICDCKAKGKRGIVMDCDTRCEKSVVHIMSLHYQALFKWKSLKLLQPSIDYIYSRTKAFSTDQFL